MSSNENKLDPQCSDDVSAIAGYHQECLDRTWFTSLYQGLKCTASNLDFANTQTFSSLKKLK